jgi:hypothetical protein
MHSQNWVTVTPPTLQTLRRFNGERRQEKMEWAETKRGTYYFTEYDSSGI